MDLQLGLGISTGSSSSPEEFHSGQIGGGGGFSYSSGGSNDTESRFLDQTFDGRNADRQIPQTLPLLVWNENENENLENGLDHEYYDEHIQTETNSVEFNRDANGDVGWPPVSYRRKRMSNQNRGGGERNMDWVAVEDNGGDNGGRGRNSLFVKVNMVGEGIGRKVDLTLHHSVHSLIQTLLAMFGKYDESVHSYKLAYQDEDGYWHLAEQNSWGAFIGNACRLRLLKNN